MTMSPVPQSLNRRSFLAAGVSASALLLPGCAALSSRTVQPKSLPFTLGIASGEPSSDGFLIWTRILPREFDPEQLHPDDAVVRWEVAHDESFARIVASGRERASASAAHTIHIELKGLAADSWYHYRFHCGAFTSAVGRTRTLPLADAQPKSLRFAVASCQHFEQGYFAAQKHLADEHLDLIWFVGDYIYEYGPTGDPNKWPRRHDSPHCHTLTDYRRRYAQYKGDEHVQAMHASAPFLPIWDDHEVDNDYAGIVSRDHHPAFAVRRAAAYRAYLEHMPLRMPRLLADGTVMLYRSVDFGRLACFHALDVRQFRDEQPCSPAGRGAGYVAASECVERLMPNRSMLGQTQERWFDRSLTHSTARWNVIAQTTLVAQAMMARRVWVDGWDGYPAARDRFIGQLARPGVSNPVVVGGDVHATYVSDLRLDTRRDDSKVVATEFCGTSITSPSWSQAATERLLRENPCIRYGRSDKRGYLRFELRAERLEVALRAVDDAFAADASVETLVTFAVEDSRPGIG
jgi:alkaline phosphatase D